MEIMLKGISKRIGGERSTELYQIIKKLIEEEMKEDDGKMIFNFSEIEYIDSSGLGSIVAINSLLAKRGRKLVLKNVPDNLIELLKITNLINILEITSGEDNPDESGMEALREIKERLFYKKTPSFTPKIPESLPVSSNNIPQTRIEPAKKEVRNPQVPNSKKKYSFLEFLRRFFRIE